MTNNPKHIIISLGRVQRAKGLQGDLRITTNGELLGYFPKNTELSLYQCSLLQDGILQNPRFIENITLKNKAVLKVSAGSGIATIQCQQIDSKDKADKLKGLYLGIDLAKAKEIAEEQNEIYLFQYIEILCHDKDEPNIKGNVMRIEQNGNANWLIVQYKDQEIMVPLVEPYVQDDPISGKSFAINGLKNLIEYAK